MYPRRKIDHGWQKKTSGDHQYRSSGINFCKYPVQSNMSKEDEEVKEQTVDIIITPAENIKKGNQFNDDIFPQVIPKGIRRTKHA